MNFKLKKPCSTTCPFHVECRRGWLGYDRASEIAEAITDLQQTFACHKTTQHNDDDGYVETENEQHCAGALIMLEHMGRPNQMMRIAERLGFYDRNGLDMDAPVFTDVEDFIDHHSD